MSAASFSAALPGGSGLGAPLPIDWRLLNRAGKVWQAIQLLWTEDPRRNVFPDDAIASVAKVCVKTARRGLSELERSGLVAIERDRSRPCWRSILPIPLPAPLDRSVPSLDRTVPEDGQNGPPSYVERKSASASYVIREEVPAVGPFCPSDSGSASERLTVTLGRLDHDPSVLEGCVDRLAREFGRDFVPFYRKTLRQVLSGQLAIGDLIGAAEEADQPHIRHRGKAFTTSIKRRLAERAERRLARSLPAPVEPSRPEPPVEPQPEIVPTIAEPPVETTPEPSPAPSEPAVPAAPAATATTASPATPADDEVQVKALWDAMPEPRKEEVRSKVKAANPSLARWKNVIESHCLAAIKATTPIPLSCPELSVEVLPTDRQLGSLIPLSNAEDPVMRWLVRGELARLGRGDVVTGVPWEKGPAGEPPKGLPAGPQPPRRSPG